MLFKPSKNSHLFKKQYLLSRKCFLFVPVDTNQGFGWEQVLMYGNFPSNVNCIYSLNIRSTYTHNEYWADINNNKTMQGSQDGTGWSNMPGARTLAFSDYTKHICSRELLFIWDWLGIWHTRYRRVTIFPQSCHPMLDICSQKLAASFIKDQRGWWWCYYITIQHFI